MDYRDERDALRARVNELEMAFAAGGKGWVTTIPADPVREQATAFEGIGADLAGGIFVAGYQLVGGGCRMVALDANSGERRWDIMIPRSKSGSCPGGITATDTRVYVPHWTWLDIFDLRTGRLLGTIGKW